MNEVHVIINEKNYTFPANITILEACNREGISIPTLCYLKGICEEGSCGLCVVKVEKSRAFDRACNTILYEGMKITTDSEAIFKARKMNLELTLAHHPLDCMTCDKDGDCTLQDLAYQFGIKKSRFLTAEEQVSVLKANAWKDNPFILFDEQKCVLCRRCVNACMNQAQVEAIGIANRGYLSKVSTPFDLPLESTTCQFCAACVQACPVGALIEKTRIGKGKLKDFTKTDTTCAYCGVGCNLSLYKDHHNNLIMAKGITGEGSSVNGRTCVKGRYGHEYTQHPDRLTTPLIRKNGVLEPATWEEALSYTAQRLHEIKAKYGPDSIGLLGSSRCTNEDNYAIMKFARATIGTNNVDNCARLCHSSTVAGLAKSFGAGAATNSYSDFNASDVYFDIGSNTTETHPVIAQIMKEHLRKSDCILIVCDPRKTDISKYAKLHLQHTPGTDVALLNGIMKIILDEHFENSKFIEEHVEGFETFRQKVNDYPLEKVAQITGVKAELIKEAAMIIGKAKSMMTFYSMGITQHSTGVDNVLSIANLSLLTGNLGKPGAGIMALRGQANVQGACDMGALPNVFSGYQAVTDPTARQKFETEWKVKLSDKVGIQATLFGEKALAGELKAAYIMGENPLMTDADITAVREGFDKIEFIAVQNIFMCETVSVADVVFPSTSAYEKYGTFVNTERRVQLLRPCREHHPNVKDDWEIVSLLSKKMGYDLGFESVQDVNQEINRMTPTYGGISLERLEKTGLQWPCPTIEHPGTPILHKDGVTKRPNQKGLLHAIDFISAKELPDQEYPFVLTTGRILYHFHSGNETRRTSVLNEFIPKNYVEINPLDAVELGIQQNDIVVVATRRGKLELHAKISERPKKGIVFIPFHFSEAPANILTNAALDPVAKIPEFKVAACSIQRK